MSQRLSEMFFPEGDEFLQTSFPEAYSALLFPRDVAQKCPEVVLFPKTANEGNDDHAKSLFPPVRRPGTCVFAILGMILMYYYAWKFVTLAVVQLQQTTTTTKTLQQPKRRNILLLFLWSLSFFFMGSMNTSAIFLHSLHPAPDTSYPKENPMFWICDTFCTGASLLTFYVASIVLIWPRRGCDTNFDATPDDHSDRSKWSNFLSSSGVRSTIGIVLFNYSLGLLAMIAFFSSSSSLYLELYYLLPGGIFSAPWNIYLLLVWFKKASKQGTTTTFLPPRGVLLCFLGYIVMNVGLHLDKFICRAITYVMTDPSFVRDILMDSGQQMTLIFAGTDCLFLGSAWLLLEREAQAGRLQQRPQHSDQTCKVKAT